ncbi:androglobin-like [Melitaea cinxia]|uniref:androglobin-like n=1 Tax=Melitaea cinxia TaxID=113334 RepID=UPI001E273134|nr:androglobin-like [Melitaea cinxia]
MSKKSDMTRQSVLVHQVDPSECPFREFRDNEISPDFWGMGPAAFRASHFMSKTGKSTAEMIWVDDQTQPLPKSARQYLHGWVKAEELASRRWDAEVVVFEEDNGGKMTIMDMQLSHAQVLLRSSFCRRVLSICYMLERVDGLIVEHQWENFVFNMTPEGWRSRYHIYSPGMKPGGGPQHRPTLSKNGCYLVRLFYLGAWRCVWVSDQVPVDATDSPLLPFSPLLSPNLAKSGVKQAATVTSNVVHLWPLLICKALLKLAAPDMNSDDTDCEDELMSEFDIVHALTGAVNLIYNFKDPEVIWELLTSEVPVFSWDNDDDTVASTVKTRSTKKPTTKETTVVRRGSMTSIIIKDTKDFPPYALPGITPGHEMDLLVIMVRDLPLKKPQPEPSIPLWKTYRWLDWARQHGLYEAYDCPRTRFLKLNGLLKLSYAPHLLDVQSTESITFQFREEHDKLIVPTKKAAKDLNRSTTANSTVAQQIKEELREWIQFNAIQKVIKTVNILYYPSMYSFTSVASNPMIRITKAAPNKALDIQAPKFAPLYLQLDGPDENVLRISLNTLHPRVLLNCGVPIIDYVEPAYLIFEVFEWFVDCDLPKTKAFIETRGYDSVELKLSPGRHICRIWVHSRMNWHAMLLSESSLLLGRRDVVQCAAVKECPWAARFLSNLGSAFSNWIRVNRSTMNISGSDKEFYRSYQPDLEWNPEIVGYNKSLLHWMFRQALQSLFFKILLPPEFRAVCTVLRKYFCDPDFGMPTKPLPPKSLREIELLDPCDCALPEIEEIEIKEDQLEEQIKKEKVLIEPEVIDKLLTQPEPPIISRVCELATEELPCELLKAEREKVIRKHEAATVIQAHWRGTWARKCLTNHVPITPEISKAIMECAFGNLEALSALMNELFTLYPGAKTAYSVASALSGVYGINQYTGISPITPKCKWIPYFQGVFNCHAPVKVHLDIHSSLQHSILSVYNNDTGEQMPQAYNEHITFSFEPNDYGYTVMGHGSLSQAAGVNSEVHWQLTVLSSIANVFHICDNDTDLCKELNLIPSNKLHIDEIFIPNRRNILGGIQILVTKLEAVSFRAAATSPDLEMEAILRTLSSDGQIDEIARCSGTGELYWPYIKLEPTLSTLNLADKKRSVSQSNLATATRESAFSSARSLKGPKQKQYGVGGKSRSTTKVKDIKIHLAPKQYYIEVVAPNGWPLTLAQWNRVDEIRNSLECNKVETPAKKQTTKEKAGSAKDKDKDKAFTIPINQPQLGDAYVELECSLAVGVNAVRNDERDLQFAAARKAWDANEPGRNLRGAQIRKEFRSEYLESLPLQPSESSQTIPEEIYAGEILGEEKKELPSALQQGPTPATESELLEMSVESEEEAKYLTMPEQLRDKFIPLYFVPFCTKEIDEDKRIVVTPEMIEDFMNKRHKQIDEAINRMHELQLYNEEHVLGRQKDRCQLLEKLFVDSQWNPKLNKVFEQRDDAIAREALNRTLSATKKKQEGKKK